MSCNLIIHVVDTTRNSPASGMHVDIYRLGGRAAKLCSAEVGAGGEIEDAAILGALDAGEYEVVFHVGDYYRRQGFEMPSIPFLDGVPCRFGIDETCAVTRLPFRVSPWGFALAIESSAEMHSEP